MAMQYRGGVIVLDDETNDAEDMVERVRGTFPDVYIMTTQPSDDDHTITVSEKQFGVRSLVREMVQRDAYWSLLPKGRDPVTVIADYLAEARHALSEDFPGFVLIGTVPGVRYRRIAIVADVRAPVTTGVLALTGVGLACHLGTSLDVLLLGADRDDPPQTWHDVEQLLQIRAGAGNLEKALEVADEHGLTVNWVALGESGQRDQLVLDAVVDGGYDLVFDDLEPMDVGPIIGRRNRVKRQLLEGQTDTAYRLLRDAPCDVGIVVDAVTMNLMPGGALAAGAAAALSLGMVGTSIQPSETPTEAAMVQTVESGASPAGDAVAEAEAQAVEAPPAEAAAPVISTPAPPIDALAGRISAQEYGEYRATFGNAEAEASAAQAELHARAGQQAAAEQTVVMAQSDLALVRSDAASAQATEKSAEDRLKYSKSGKDRLTDEEEARALGSLNQAKRAVERQQARVAQAEAALAAARQSAADAATAVAAQQPVVDAHNANLANWNNFLSTADARTPKVVSPLPGHGITTGYGVAGGRWSSGRHTGIDFAAPSGTAVVAAADGVVTFAGRNGPYGNQIKVQHSDGTTTAYAHLSSISVSAGQHVGAGQRIGGVGSTGNSTGPHLHFEVLDSGGGFLNPQSWLRSKGAI